MPCTLLAQEAAKLPNVKFGGLKNLYHLCAAQVRVPNIFSVSSTLLYDNLAAPSAKRMQSKYLS